MHTYIHTYIHTYQKRGWGVKGRRENDPGEGRVEREGGLRAICGRCECGGADQQQGQEKEAGKEGGG